MNTFKELFESQTIIRSGSQSAIDKIMEKAQEWAERRET